MAAQGNSVPDLPPEWGEVVIPDDLAELDAEAEAVRRELHRQQGEHGDGADLAVPQPERESLWLILLILGICVVVTLLSLGLAVLSGVGVEPTPAPPTTGGPG